MTFGARVRQLRHARGLTIRQVAEAVERDFTYVSKIENDRVMPPSAGVIVKLADLLGCDAEELATLGDKPPVAVLRRRLAHAEAEVDRLRAAIAEALHDLDHRDEAGALDRLHAALGGEG